MKDFIEALEFLTRDLEVSQNQRIHVQYEIEKVSDISSLEKVAGARTGEDDVVSDAATERLSTLGSSGGRGTTIASNYVARAWAETELPPVPLQSDVPPNKRPVWAESVLSPADESVASLQSDVSQNRRIMAPFTQPKAETFAASKKTSFWMRRQLFRTTTRFLMLRTRSSREILTVWSSASYDTSQSLSITT